MKRLVIGGARSGKSRTAEALAVHTASLLHTPLVYVATAQSRDDEMAQRISQHQMQRGDGWHTIEETIAIADVITDDAHEGKVILVDCLTLWLSNLMEAQHDVAGHSSLLCTAIQQTQADVIFVANEVGLGIVPDNKLARDFRDLAGLMNQQVASVCDQVIFMAAGLPMVMKGEPL